MLFSNGTFYNNSGVQIRAPGFGNTTTVEILDPSLETITGYFSTFVSHFANLGYKRGINITAVPYDWRQSPGLWMQVVVCIGFKKDRKEDKDSQGH